MTEIKKDKFFYGWIVAGALFLISFLPMTFVNTFFSYYQVPICSDFGISYARFNIANTLSSLGAMLFSLFMSTRVTKGRIRVWMLIGALVASVSYFAMGYTTAIWQIYILIFIAVFFVSAITYTPINFLISQWFVYKKGIVTSVIFSGYGIGGVLFSAFEASFIANHGWRSGFRLTSAVVFLTALVAVLLIRKSPSDMGLQPYTAKTADGESEGKKNHEVSGATKAEALKSKSFWLYAVVMLFIGVTSAGIVTQIPTYLTDNNVNYALVMSVVSAAMIVAKLLLGVVVDRVGILKGTVLASICGIVGLAVLMLVPGIGAIAAYVAAILIPLGTSTSSVAPPLFTSILFGNKDFGGIYGIGNSFFFVGCMVGPLISSGICTALGSYSVAWVVFCFIFAVLSLFAVLSMKARKEY